MLKSLAFIILVILSKPAWALVPPDYQDPSNEFNAEIEAGFQLNTGNTESTSFNGRSKLVYKSGKAKQEMTLKGYFASDDEKTTSEKYDLQYQSNYKVNSGYIFGRGDFTWDKFGSFTKIATVSAGYGFDLIKNDNTKLSLEIGPGFRYNLPVDNDPINDPIPEKDIIVRTAAKLTQKIQEYTSLNADVATETGKSNNTIALELGYKNTVFQDWAFKVGFNIKYTEIVPDNTKKTDTTTMFNLLYTFQ